MVDGLDFKRQQWVEGRTGQLQENIGIKVHSREHTEYVYCKASSLGDR